MFCRVNLLLDRRGAPLLQIVEGVEAASSIGGKQLLLLAIR